MDATQQIAERKARWQRFLDPRQPPSSLYMIHYGPDEEPQPHLWPQCRQERIEWAWRKYERQMARLEWLADDTLPHLDMVTGTEIFAEAFGCPVQYPEDSNPFARPIITEARQVAALKVPEVSATPLAMLFEMADELRRRAGPEALVKLIDVQSPMDIAALIWDKNRFYVAIHESPEAVQELAAKVSQLLTQFLDAWFQRYGRAFIAHYPSYYMPQGITLSEDEVGCVSPQMYETFFAPELAQLSARYGGIGMHCCAHARHQWAGFKRIPDLRLLNLVQPPEVLREAWTYFAGLPQLHSWSGEGEAWTWPAQHPAGSRICMEVRAETRDEALQLAERMAVACGRGL